MDYCFDHEKLEVYQLALEFIAWCEQILKRPELRGTYAKKHLDEASSSIPNNIAEGNGKWSSKERRRFFEIARGSSLECASCLDTLVAKQRLIKDDVNPGKAKLRSIVNMLTKMILNLSRSNSEVGLEDEFGIRR